MLTNYICNHKQDIIMIEAQNTAESKFGLKRWAGSLFSGNKEFLRPINARTVTSPVAALLY